MLCISSDYNALNRPFYRTVLNCTRNSQGKKREKSSCKHACSVQSKWFIYFFSFLELKVENETVRSTKTRKENGPSNNTLVHWKHLQNWTNFNKDKHLIDILPIRKLNFRKKKQMKIYNIYMILRVCQVDPRSPLVPQQARFSLGYAFAGCNQKLQIWPIGKLAETSPNQTLIQIIQLRKLTCHFYSLHFC